MIVAFEHSSLKRPASKLLVGLIILEFEWQSLDKSQSRGRDVE